MDTETMIQQLEAVAEKHHKDKLNTFDTNITAMCEDVISKLKQLKKYEDTGLTPEQIRDMDSAYLEKCEQVNVLKEFVEATCKEKKLEK